jgi:hypothetical protein
MMIMSDDKNATAQVTTQAEAKTEQTTQATESKDGQAQQANAQDQQAPETKETTSVQQPVVPEVYDLKLPDGSQLNTSRLEQIAGLAKSKGLSQDQAQAMVNSESEALGAYVKGQLDQFEQMKSKWVDDAKADPEIGGEKFKENIELAHRVLKKFGTQTFSEELERTGFGNHPELVRVFAKIGKQMADDQLVIARAQGGEQKSAAELLYGTTKP